MEEDYRMARMFIILLILTAGLAASLPYCGRGTQETKIDYEYDLTERCKDWIHYRNKTFRLAKQGDHEGAAEARRYMLAYMEGLEARFTDEQIAEEINRIEESGYK